MTKRLLNKVIIKLNNVKLNRNQKKYIHMTQNNKTGQRGSYNVSQWNEVWKNNKSPFFHHEKVHK